MSVPRLCPRGIAAGKGARGEAELRPLRRRRLVGGLDKRPRLCQILRVGRVLGVRQSHILGIPELALGQPIGPGMQIRRISCLNLLR